MSEILIFRPEISEDTYNNEFVQISVDLSVEPGNIYDSAEFVSNTEHFPIRTFRHMGVGPLVRVCFLSSEVNAMLDMKDAAIKNLQSKLSVLEWELAEERGKDFK